jgi:signal transduction histidine kinase
VDQDGKIIGRLWTFLDITHIRKLEQRVAHQAEQLKEQARQLASDLRSVSGRLIRVESELTLTQRQLLESERMSAAGLLGASVAHNIRNILTPLNIELSLARAATTPEQQAESFNVIEGQLERLSLMTHRLLAIARPADSEPAAIDMGHLVTHATDLVAAQAAEENVKIETKCSSRTPEVLGDPVQLDQLIVNLALNGIQAMHAKGGGKLGLKVYPGKDGVCVQVTDTGDGIPPETRKRLFDPFFSTRPDGTGLGLYSCRRIAQEHGGKISVRSTMGQGTRVTVWLPVGEVENAGKNLGG